MSRIFSYLISSYHAAEYNFFFSALAYRRTWAAARGQILTLINSNTSDFCSRNNRKEIHEELLDDCSKFVVFNSSHDFLREKNKELNLIPSKFEKYIRQLHLSKESIRMLLEGTFYQEIFEFVREEFVDMEMNEIFDEEHWDTLLTSHIETKGLDVLECEDYDITIVKDNAFINGQMLCSAILEGYQINPFRNRSDQRQTYLGSGNTEFYIGFSFTLMKDSDPSDLEVSNLRIA